MLVYRRVTPFLSVVQDHIVHGMSPVHPWSSMSRTQVRTCTLGGPRPTPPVWVLTTVGYDKNPKSSAKRKIWSTGIFGIWIPTFTIYKCWWNWCRGIYNNNTTTNTNTNTVINNIICTYGTVIPSLHGSHDIYQQKVAVWASNSARSWIEDFKRTFAMNI